MWKGMGCVAALVSPFFPPRQPCHPAGKNSKIASSSKAILAIREQHRGRYRGKRYVFRLYFVDSHREEPRVPRAPRRTGQIFRPDWARTPTPSPCRRPARASEFTKAQLQKPFTVYTRWEKVNLKDNSNPSCGPSSPQPTDRIFPPKLVSEGLALILSARKSTTDHPEAVQSTKPCATSAAPKLRPTSPPAVPGHSRSSTQRRRPHPPQPVPREGPQSPPVPSPANRPACRAASATSAPCPTGASPSFSSKKRPRRFRRHRPRRIAADSQKAISRRSRAGPRQQGHHHRRSGHTLPRFAPNRNRIARADHDRAGAVAKSGLQACALSSRAPANPTLEQLSFKWQAKVF